MDAETIVGSELAAIVDTALGPFVRVDDDGFVTAASRSVSELLGWTSEQLVGLGVLDIVAPAFHDPVLEGIAAASEPHRVVSNGRVASGLIIDLRTESGATVACDVAVATSVRTGLDGYVVQIRPAGPTAALRQTIQAMGAGALLGEVLQSVAAVLEASLASTAAEVAHGVSGDRFTSFAGSIAVLAADDGGPGDRPWMTVLSDGETVRRESLDGLPAAVRRAADEIGAKGFLVHPICLETTGTPVGAVVAWTLRRTPSAFYRDAMEEAADLAALAIQWDEGLRSLRWAAAHDELTKVGNRHTFMGELRRAQSSGLGGAVLYVDLDDFKPINDRYGHLIGDEVLTAAAGRFARCLRPDASLARIGGDEFAVLWPGCRSRSEAEGVGVRLLEALEAPIAVRHGEDTVAISVTASVGVALLDAAGSRRVLAAADADLLAAKAGGKGQVGRSRPAH